MTEAFALPPEARAKLELWRAGDARVVFTNGVFDLLHRGHAEYLEDARALGDRLVVGLNTDASVRRLKGPSRPIVGEQDRAALVRALACVDLVVLFDDDTPQRLIEAVKPDVLVKGADYAPADIVGREFVESRGGRVTTVPLREGLSTSELVKRIKEGKGV
ncbi:MAG TPA: D-glycero-beta-D-manno-heptose 1-phosphate adenylyltransferase [Methylomirabilota bacterium]|nr:D-glycero-beta-D-manno-heptose 1-phosphate adenylyltransferase [Methylomirabilota bacterium]